MPRSMVLAAVCGVIAVACIGGGALFFVERPTIVRVAIPDGNQGDYELLSAASKVVRHNHQPIRFKLISTSDAKGASEALDTGKVDMAVVRTDSSMPADGQTVVILHRDAAVMIVPHGSELKDVPDLSGHTVGVVGNPENRKVLDTILEQYDVPLDHVKTIPLASEGVENAAKDGSVDAVLVTGIVAGQTVQSAVKAVAKASGGAPGFIGVPESEAVAQRSPAYDSFEVVKGAFHGSPPLPADEFNTLSVTHRLVANSQLSDRTVADVTRFLLSERGAIMALDPMAQRIEAPSTDKGAILPAHAGTEAYIDDEEESFLDQYSDYIYLGAMFFGVLASGGTALFSRLSAQGAKNADRLIRRLIEMMKLARSASSAELRLLEDEADAIVVSALDGSTVRSLEDRDLRALGLILDQVREAIRSRKQTLDTGPHPLAFSNDTVRMMVAE